MLAFDFKQEKDLLRRYHLWYIYGKAELSPYVVRRFFKDEEEVRLGALKKLVGLCDQLRAEPEAHKVGEKPQKR